MLCHYNSRHTEDELARWGIRKSILDSAHSPTYVNPYGLIKKVPFIDTEDQRIDRLLQEA